MKKRYTVRTHPILVIEGRLLILMILVFMAMTIILTFVLKNLLFIVCAVVFIPLGIFVLYNFWHNCFGKLIITKDFIKYKCLFTKTVVFNIEDVKYIDIREFREGNVTVPKNGVCQKYLLISPEPFPDMRIDKIKRSRKIIKFPLGFKISYKLSVALSECLPEPRNRMFAAKRHIYERNKAKRKKYGRKR